MPCGASKLVNVSLNRELNSDYRFEEKNAIGYITFDSRKIKVLK